MSDLLTNGIKGAVCVEYNSIWCNPIKKPKQVQHCIMYKLSIYSVIPVFPLYAYWILFIKEIKKKKDENVHLFI